MDLNRFLSTPEGKALIKNTTPQPSAAEVPSPLGDWHEPAIAAVGAQGDGVALMREASEVLAAVGTSGVALPENWRWPLVDELSGQAALLSAAPAAGKGVDDAMVELIEADKEYDAAYVTDMDCPSSADTERFRRATLRREAALEAALTRQPVAGDGMVLVPREPTLASLQAAHLAYWGTTPSNHWHECSEPLWRKAYAAMLAAAPAATPTDDKENPDG